MSDRVFSYHKIPKDFVTDHLNKIHTGMIHSIDQEFSNEYLKMYFYYELLESLGDFSKKCIFSKEKSWKNFINFVDQGSQRCQQSERRIYHFQNWNYQ